ncbi:ROK family protein [Desertivirga brevis]|uniref:ROK family protein n=1 Tax=Desertivirga brevis TaxID=2810310 RepID=UPI001A96F9FA|nr:ROK family protein [Pedobacter sp. SYSU D00873]
MVQSGDELNIIGAAIEDRYISAGIVDFKTRRVIDKTLRRKRVNPAGSADEIISAWTECFQEVLTLKTSDCIRIGMGVPNLLDYENGIYLGNDPKRYGSLYKLNLKQVLGSNLLLPEDQIKIQNVDACFFQGEVFAGAVRGYQRSFGITLGVGLGTARYSEGRVEDANLWKSAFKDSIAEDYLSQRWLLKRFYDLSGIEVADLVEMKRYANEFVEKTFEEFGINLGQFITTIIQNERPDAICIGGQMESSNRFFFETATNYVQASGFKTPIIKAILGEKAYVIGTGSLWSTELLHS